LATKTKTIFWAIFSQTHLVTLLPGDASSGRTLLKVFQVRDLALHGMPWPRTQGLETTVRHFSPAKKPSNGVPQQGDPIGAIFTNWTIVYLEQYFLLQK
jgi:hypothetical protein